MGAKTKESKQEEEEEKEEGKDEAALEGTSKTIVEWVRKTPSEVEKMI